MLFQKREKTFKVCPRCGLKSLSIQETCPDCGLVFARLEIATNKDAKKLIRRRETDYIIKTSTLPKDVNYYKLLMWVLFTGIFGGHCFRVGRYWRGGLLLVNFLLIIVYFALNSKIIQAGGTGLIASLCTISGLIMLVWIYDIIMIAIKKFKVPVAIDLDSDLEANK